MKMLDGNTSAELMHARAEGEPALNQYTPAETISHPDTFGDLLHDCEDIYWLTPLAECFGAPLSAAIQALGTLEDLTRVAGNVAHVQAVLDLRGMLHKLSDLEKEATNQAEACNGE